MRASDEDFSTDGVILRLTAHRAQHGVLWQDGRETAIVFRADQLPFASATCAGLSADGWFSQQAHPFAILQRLAAVMRAGGKLSLTDYLLPPDARDAQYIRALEQLRQAPHPVGYDEYEWRGLLLDAGLKLVRVEPNARHERHDLLWHAATYTPEQAERLHVMLLRAPVSVAKWLAPEYAGTTYATFQRHLITIVAQKV